MWTEATEKQLKIARIVAAALLVGAPAVYLVIANLVDVSARSGGEYDILFYILLVVGAVEPVIAYVIERYQLDVFRMTTDSKMSPGQLLTNISIIKCAMVDAVFIYGLVVVFLGGGIERMLLFYPIGIIWAFIHWPRRGRWETQIQKLEMP